MRKWISKLFRDSVSKQTSKCEAGQEYVSLDKHIRRLMEIEQALGKIGDVFTRESGRARDTAKAGDPLQPIVEMTNTLRVPGFFAYHLAQEGLALLNVIAACAALTKRNSGSSEKIDTIISHIDEAEPRLRQTLNEMEPYRSMDAKETFETIAMRIAASKAK